MNCEHCSKEVENKRFCNISCARKYASKKQVKMTVQGKCAKCETPIKAANTYCKDCWNKRAEPDKERKCPICGIVKDKSNSFAPKGKYYQAYCKECNSKKSAERARNFKRDCVQYKGGKCENCGYDKCNGALDFHHKDPTQKDFTIAYQKNRSINDKIKKELDKCSLLCANCHREEHYRLSELKNEFLN